MSLVLKNIGVEQSYIAFTIRNFGQKYKDRLALTLILTSSLPLTPRFTLRLRLTLSHWHSVIPIDIQFDTKIDKILINRMRCSAQSYLRLVVSFCSTINSFFLAAKLCIHKFFCCVWHFNWFFGPNVLGFQWLKLPLPARMLESPKIRSTSSVFVDLGSQQRRLTCGRSAISFDRLPLHQLNYHLLHCFAFMFHLCYPFPHSAGGTQKTCPVCSPKSPKSLTPYPPSTDLFSP